MVRYLAGGGAQGISTGAIPNLGTLVGTSNQAITGARPVWFGPGVAPGPYRPDQPINHDIVARVGGDEFVVVSDAFEDPGEAVALGCRVRDVLARRIGLGSIQVEVGASVGIAFGRQPADAPRLLERARAAMSEQRRRAGPGVRLAP